MCGIWGFVSTETKEGKKITELTRALLRPSESRGKEASGIALRRGDDVEVLKRAIPATELIRTAEYRDFMASAADMLAESGFAAIGHFRLMTNGAADVQDNNQPVSRPGLTTVHNGIIVNTETIMKTHPGLSLRSEVDTEVFVALCLENLKTMSVPAAFQATYAEIYGMASTLNLLPDKKRLVAASNNGSLYYCVSVSGKSIVFASESLTLVRLCGTDALAKGLFSAGGVKQLAAGHALEIDLETMEILPFSLPSGDVARPREGSTLAPIQVDLNRYRPFEIDEAPIRALRRCTRCVLPETMPFIEFDEAGVCNYCKTYEKHEVKGEAALYEWADKQRGGKDKADSIVSFSGGRDSSYGLHVFVKELGLHPVAYSYDWGMVTDLARRNQSRMCASLGVELIVVSADIKKKRDNIRKNVAAWLKKPDLGMVPLFMAGDKQYFYYANKVRKYYGLDVVLMASNPFEKTHFKSGFCGVKPAVLQKQNNLELEQLRLSDVFRMAGHYAGQYLGNPSYINSSLWDTITATLSYYAIPHNYLRLFNYIPWNEDQVNETLLGEYAWEKSPDTDSTWRIGDGTAPFYNYIYYLVAGFSENDTLRSNQVREGMISREEALERIYRDNAPRFDSMQWYFDAIGLDMEQALNRVNALPRLYKK